MLLCLTRCNMDGIRPASDSLFLVRLYRWRGFAMANTISKSVFFVVIYYRYLIERFIKGFLDLKWCIIQNNFTAKRLYLNCIAL